MAEETAPEVPEITEAPAAPPEPTKPNFEKPSYAEFIKFTPEQLNQYVQTQADRGNSAAKLMRPVVEKRATGDAANDLRSRLPSNAIRQAAYTKGMGLVADQEAALDAMLTADNIEASKESRQKRLNAIVGHALRPEEHAKLGENEFKALNVMSMTQLGREYKDLSDLKKNFRRDAEAYNADQKRLQEEAKNRKVKYRSVGIIDGKEVSIAEMTGTGFDAQKAEEMKPSAGQVLQSDTSDPELYKSVSLGLTATPTSKEFAEFAFDSPSERKKYTSNAYRPQKTARAMDVYKPLYTDPTGKTRGIDLDIAYTSAKAHYIQKLTKNRSLATFSEAERDKIRTEAEGLARGDISRIERSTPAFVYRRNDDALQNYLDGTGILGSISTLPVLKPLLAPFLPHRKIAGTIGRRGEGAEQIAQKGVVGTYISDGGVANAIDSIFRYAPTEAVGAAYHLAHKDYVDQFGDKAEGRGTWIVKRMGQIWNSDRLVEEIATTTDNAGRLLTEAGPVLLGDFGETNPTTAAVLVGVPTFGLMLLEPDVFMGLPLVGKAAKAVGAVGKGAKAAARLRHIDRLDDGSKILNKAVDGLSAEQRANPVDVAAALQQAAREDRTGAARAILQQVAYDAGTRAGGQADNLVSIVRRETNTIKSEAKNAVKSRADAIKDIERAKDAKTAAEASEAVHMAVRNSLNAYGNDLRMAQAQLNRASAFAKKAQNDHIAMATSRAMVDDDAFSTYIRSGKAKKLDAYLSSDEAKTFFKGRDAEIKALREEIAELGTKKFDKAKDARAAKKAMREKIAKFYQKEVTSPLSKHQARLKKRADDAILKQTKAQEALNATVNSVKGVIRPDAVQLLTRTLKGVGGKGIDAAFLAKQQEELVEQILELQKTQQAADAAIRRASEEIATAEGIAKAVGDEVQLGPKALRAQTQIAEAMLDNLAKVSAAIDVAKTRRGGDEIKKLVEEGRGVEEIVADTARLDEIRKLASDDLAALSNEDFLEALTKADLAERMWAAPATMNKIKIGLFTDAFTQPRMWYAATSIRVNDLFTRKIGTIFNTRVALLGPRFGKGIDRIAKRTARFARAAGQDLSLIVRYAPEAERSSLIRQYLTSGDVVQLRPGIEVTGNVGMGASFFETAKEGFLNIARVIPKNEKAREVFFKNQQSASLEGFVKAFISDNVSGGEALKAGEAVMKFVTKLKDAPADLTLEGMQKLAFDAIGEAGIRRVADTFDDIPPKDMSLSYKSIVAGAVEETYTAKVANLVGAGLNLRNVRAYERFIGRGKEIIPARQTIEKGDMVVLKADVETYRTITNRTQQTAKKRGPASSLEKVATEGSAPSMELMEIVTIDGVAHGRVVLNGKPKDIPIKDLTLREPELSFLDVADAYLRFGPDLVEQAYKKDLANNIRQASDEFMELVAHSKDANGNMRIVPRFKLGTFSKSLDDISKKLTENLSDAAAGNPLTQNLAATGNKMLSLWKRHVLGGLMAPNPGFFVNNQVGDFSQMATELSIGEAAVISMYGSLGYIPYLGTRLQDATRKAAQAAGDVGLRLPSLFDANFNRFIDDVLEGSDEIRTYKKANGETVEVNPAKLMNEALEDGIDDSIRHADWGTELRKAADRDIALVEKGIRASNSAIRTLQDAKDEYFDIMDVTMRASQRRQRLQFYAHLRFNKGMSRDEAADMMSRALYDYQTSVGKFETEWIARFSAFYTFSKNAIVQNFNALFHGSDDLMDYAKRHVTFNTKQQRMEAMSRFANVVFHEQYVSPSMGIGEGEDPAGLSPAEQRRMVREREIPDWLMDYIISDVGTLTPEGQRLMSELGRDRVNFAKTVSTRLTSIEFQNMYSEMIHLVSGAAIAGLRDDVDFDTRQGASFILEEFVNMMNPIAENMFEDTMKKLAGLPVPPKSAYGKPLTAAELEFARLFGMTDSLGITETNGKIRSNDNLIKTGLLDMAGREANRLRLMASVVFGTDLGALTPVETRAYLAGMDKSEVEKRLTVLGQLMNIQRVYLFHGDETASYTVKAQRRELTREYKKAGKEGMVE
jgi:hypothetical protein